MPVQMAPRSQRETSETDVEQIRAEHEQARVQRRAAAHADVGLAYDHVHASAEGGVTGAGDRLPHLDAIQRSFGAYDIGGVRAHQGGQAAAACEQIGAQAYATGDRVAFAGPPDLHTAAHEAAHVIQQRAGVGLAGGVGQEGDAHEQLADRIADAVVAGEPADYLLAQIASPAAATGAGTRAVQRKPDKPKLPEGEEGFQQLWDAHPHNYQDDDAQNTTSEQVREDHGLPEMFENTCAIRISIMLNSIGETITPAKTAAAGLTRRPHYSRKTKQYYILAASEVWQYLGQHYRQADVTFPADGTRYKDADGFQTAFEATIQPELAGHKGIVAFDRIFGYGGTGHVDIFDGENLSNAAGWYPCQRLLLWYVAVP